MGNTVDNLIFLLILAFFSLVATNITWAVAFYYTVKVIT